MRFHNLQALVSQGRGIQRHLFAHTPIGMVQALSQCHIFQLTALFTAEGTTRSGDDKALDLIFSTPAQRLKNSAMLAVHRSQAYTLISYGLHHNAARRH